MKQSVHTFPFFDRFRVYFKQTEFTKRYFTNVRVPCHLRDEPFLWVIVMMFGSILFDPAVKVPILHLLFPATVYRPITELLPEECYDSLLYVISSVGYGSWYMSWLVLTLTALDCVFV